MKEIKLNEFQKVNWVFTCVFDCAKRRFIIYANGKKSFTSAADSAPEAMKEYFEALDSEAVKL